MMEGDVTETQGKCSACRGTILEKSYFERTGDPMLQPIGRPLRGYMKKIWFCGKCGIKYQFIPKADVRRKRSVSPVRKPRRR